MKTNRKILAVVAFMTVLVAGIVYFNFENEVDIPVVVIANYGPHSSLDAAVNGIKEELAREGFVEGKTVQYAISDVGFDAALIPQMVVNLRSHKPKVVVAITTPVAQFAKGTIKDIPIVFGAITHPVEAGLLKDESKSEANVTGSSDKQDLRAFLQFVKQLLPSAKRVGLLYATAESNDVALVKMMKQAAKDSQMEVVAIPIDQARDVQMKMHGFKDKVDLIYVGTSGPIQPTLPVIVAEAKKMDIPVFNVEEGAVKDGLVLASFGVDYNKVGVNAGRLVSQVLRGISIAEIDPVYPESSDHSGFIHKKTAKEMGITIPDEIENVEFVD